VNANFIREQIERYTGKITPGKALAALAVVYIVVRILGFILGLFDAVLPFVILGLIAYFGYQFLQGQSPAAQKIKSTVSDVTARRSAAEAVSDDVIQRISRPKEITAAPIAPEETPKIETVNVLADESAETVIDEVEVAAPKMQVAQKINPATGLAEPDLARLEEREKEKPKDDANSVLSQLEERKRRLKGG
jgi:hypothetical protein